MSITKATIILGCMTMLSAAGAENTGQPAPQRRAPMDIHLKDYLAVGNTTMAMKQALQACQDGDTLHLGGGRIDFHQEHAAERDWYYPFYGNERKYTAISIEHKRNLTIDGDGADLVFHGDVAPFSIENSAGITLRNFSIDYKYPLYAQALISATGEDWFELTFDQQEFFCKIQGNQFLFYSDADGWTHGVSAPLITEFSPDGVPTQKNPYFACLNEPDKNSFLYKMMCKLEAEQVDERTIRLTGSVGRVPHTVGNYWVCAHASRKNCGIFLWKSANVQLRNIDLYNTTAMGIVGIGVENLTIDDVNSVVREGSGRMLAVKDDAVHLVNCSGTVEIANCTFKNMIDDAVNVHGVYAVVERKENARTLLVRFDYPPKKALAFYSVGDKVLLIDRETLAQTAANTITELTQVDRQHLRLVFENELPESVENTLIEDRSRMPFLHIHDCVTGNNRPRGFLIATPKAVVENCTFFNMSSAIVLTGETKNYFESGPVSDLTIRNNRFHNSAYTGGPVISNKTTIGTYGGTGFHRGITITDNDFRLNGKRFISLRYCDDVVFRNNTYTRDPSLPYHGEIGNEGGAFTDCNNVVWEAPQTPTGK